MTLSAVEAAKLNNSGVVAQDTAFGTELYNTQTKQAGQPYCIRVAITADATGGQSVTIPYNMYLIDMVVQCNATVSGGTVQLRNSTTAITDAVVMATNHAVTRVGTIDDDHEDLLTSDSINVITHGSTDRGTVYLIGYLI